MPMISAVVFDMDGLMLDTESINRLAWQQAAEDLGYTLTDELYFSLLGRTTVDCESLVQGRLGSEFPMDEFRIRRRRLWKAQVDGGGIAAKPGLLDLLSFLEARRLPLAVATSSHALSAESSLRSAGVRDRFGIIVTGDQVAYGKPAPDIYLEAARRLGVESTSCVALEDSDSGVHAACAAGMTTVMVPDLKPASPDSIARAFRVVVNLHEAREAIEEILVIQN
jgi:beta-phosphoglucomutase-like phosphatase (HAD superfamily)